MPMPIAHGLLGAAIVAAIHREPKRAFGLSILIGVTLANAADFDFAMVFLLGSKDWHRGFSHSILFAAILGAAIIVIRGRNLIRDSFAFGIAFCSHFILDFVTTKYGDGLELFWFFNSERFGLRLFGLSEMPSKMTIPEIAATLFLEFIIFAPILAFILYLRKRELRET